MKEFLSMALLCAAVLLPGAVACMPAYRGRLIGLSLAGIFAVGGWAGGQAIRLPLSDGWAAVCAICLAGVAGAAYALLAGGIVMRSGPDGEISGPALNAAFALPALLIGGRTAQESGLAQTMETTLFDTAWSLFIPVGLGLTLLLWYGTKAGVAIRAAGDNPGAAAEGGVGAYAPRLVALALAGCTGGICALVWRLNGGGALPVGGMALLCLAALCFGRYRLWRVLLAGGALSLLAAASALNGTLDRLKALAWPPEIWQLLPYAAALALCALGGGESGGKAFPGYGQSSQGRNT